VVKLLTNTQLDIFESVNVAARLDLNSPSTERAGRQLRDEGIRKSKQHADAVEEGWHEIAYRVFEGYARTHQEFMTEDVRLFVRNHDVLGDPPDARAWGAVTRRAVRAGLVKVPSLCGAA